MKFLFNRKAHNVFKAIGDVREALGAQQYIATDEIATVMPSLRRRVPRHRAPRP